MDDCRSGLPEGLELMVPGPELAVLLDSVDRRALSGGDRLRLAQARNRLVSHLQAQLLADLYAVTWEEPPGDSVVDPRQVSRYPWSETEVAFAMRWTRVAAGGRLEQARALIEDLPAVQRALLAGDIDMPKALVVSELAGWLPVDNPELRRATVDKVMDQASRWTTGELRARLRKLILAIDPAAARKHYANAVRTRRVECVDNPSGTGELWGRDLPPHDVAAAWERLTAIARTAKAAGDTRSMDQLRADAFLDLLVGEGIAVGAPLTRHTGGLSEADKLPAESVPPSAPARTAALPGPPAGSVDTAEGSERRRPERAAAGRGKATGAAGDAQTSVEPAPCGQCGRPAEWQSGAPPGVLSEAVTGSRATVSPGPRRGVVELQVPLTTALGIDDLPGELHGYGPVLGEIARQTIAAMPDAQWRFSVYSRLPELAVHGILTTRPTPTLDRDGDRRRPTAEQAAFVRARDRTCRAPGCRRPARMCDLDHTEPWVKGGKTLTCNLGCLCRAHHLFRHTTGCDLTQLSPGVFVWQTPRGFQYLTRQDPPMLALPA